MREAKEERRVALWGDSFSLEASFLWLLWLEFRLRIVLLQESCNLFCFKLASLLAPRLLVARWRFQRAQVARRPPTRGTQLGRASRSAGWLAGQPANQPTSQPADQPAKPAEPLPRLPICRAPRTRSPFNPLRLAACCASAAAPRARYRVCRNLLPFSRRHSQRGGGGGGGGALVALRAPRERGRRRATLLGALRAASAPPVGPPSAGPE